MEGREFMTHDLQKASMWKRISAFLFDSILLVVIAVGVAFLLSAIFNFDGVVAERDELRQGYETSYGVDFDIEYEDYQKLTDEERKLYDDSYAKFATDPEANRLGALVVNLTLIIITFAVLIPSLLLEFMVPVLFGNGQTLGKKIFGIAVVRTDSVKISRFQLFIRAVLGKYTLETMVPVFLVLLLFFNVMPLFCIAMLAILFILQVAFTLFSYLHTPIHDLISGAVVVDYSSQMIFESSEKMLEYKKKLHAEEAEKAQYR
jgi:uncharacterized RDD family membrane protein YckC